MTFKDFEVKFFTVILPNKPDYIRKGQALFNFFAKTWPLEADRLVATPLDCFHVDSKIDAFLTHIEKEWPNYPY